MSLIVFQHHPDDPPARLGGILRDYGHKLRVVELHAGEAMPGDLDDVDGIVTLGGPMNVDEADEHSWMEPELDFLRRAHEAERPLVGVCLGAQLIAAALGGRVEAMEGPEVGWHRVRMGFAGTIDSIFAGLPWTTMQFHYHGHQVSQLPEAATPLAGSQACPNQAYKVGLTTYAFQYHFEWTRREIRHHLNNEGLMARASTTPDQIESQIEQYYDLYRHLGDRLVHNIADLLMPIDKRWGGRHEPAEPNPLRNWQPAKS